VESATLSTQDRGDHWFRPQGPAFAVALLVSIIVGGTLGYMWTEGVSAWDAFYMMVLAVTTVESRPDLSRAGQAFPVVLLRGGVRRPSIKARSPSRRTPAAKTC